METKNNDEEVKKRLFWMGYDSSFLVSPVGLSGGLALYWKKNINLEVLTSSSNFIDTKITSLMRSDSLQSSTSTSFVTFLYGMPQQGNRAAFWTQLGQLGEARDQAWLVLGDFNDILNNTEKVGGPPRWEGSFVAFRSFVSQQGLWDLKHSGNHLSWRGTRYQHFIKARLDRAMANSSWTEAFPAGRCQYLWFEGSDHRPVITYFNNTQRVKKGIFRFDRRLAPNEEVRDLVDLSWKNPLRSPFTAKLARCRSKLITWAKEQHSLLANKFAATQRALEEALSALIPDPPLINSLTTTLEEGYKAEESFWRQRSRIQWLREGDKNSSFFQAIARGRRSRNSITVIESEDGTEFHGDDLIASAISAHYQDIYSTNGETDTQITEEVLTPRISEQTNTSLIAIPTNEEIKEALFTINPDKAPGPDGFSSCFYRAYWSIIEEDVYRDIKEFFQGNKPLRDLNETYIRLIPKTSSSRKVGDYRPIALCSVHYKIIAKIITKRLQPHLPQLISEHQSAFVPKRAIADNILITHEILHFLKTSKAQKFCSMAVKTDMSKAYERIEWGFLKAVLQRIGFHSIWIEWIMECVGSVSYSFLVNDIPKGKVTPTRGLRQGDPLSPYLFILCTEVLSGLCKQAQSKGLLPGIKVARNSPPVNHLLFADDTMFFTKIKAGCCATLADILKRYEKASGQKINLSKSAVTFSSKTPLEAKIRVKNSLQIDKEGGIGKYLGLPEHFGRRKRDIFASIVDRVRQRAHSWSSKFLSTAGKEVLLKSVLSAMPNYVMSCFKLPCSLTKQLQSVLTRFWWDDKVEKRKMAWVAWDKLTLPKAMGGMGFKELEAFNDSLLAKLSWRIMQHPTSLLARVLMGKYSQGLSFMDCLVTSASSHGWKGILIGREVLRKGTGWRVGDGASISAWKEPWLSFDQPMKPMGPSPLNTPPILVSELLNDDDNSWNVDAIRAHLPHHEGSIRKLLTRGEKVPDSRVWLHDKTGEYSTKTGYKTMKKSKADPQVTFDWNRHIWRIKTQPKIKLFLWKALKKALAVGENLKNRGLGESLTCKRCGQLEDELHLLLTCPFASKVLELIPAIHKPSPTSCSSPEMLLELAGKVISLPPIGITSSALAPWVLWHLWKARNVLVFEKKNCSEDELVLRIIRGAIEWNDSPVVKSFSLPRSVTTPSIILPPSYTNCNVDAAWSSSAELCGMGWVFFSPGLNTKAQHSASRPFVGSALAAEALAMQAALSSAILMGYSALRVFSDAQVLVSLVNTKGSNAEIQNVLDGIWDLASHFAFVSFAFVPRKNNVEADRVAKASLLALCNSSPRGG